MGRLEPSFDYETVTALSERVAWRIDDLMPETATLAFDRPHLPEQLVEISTLRCLGESERLKLNHIRGHSYMNIFAFVEEYIIAQTVKHAEAELFGDHEAIRSLLRFGEEELKHQKLFKRYCAAFQRDFGSPCGVLGNAADVAGIILANSPLAVMLVTLHLELMTQQHYVDSVRDNNTLDPLFSNILKHHWMEEAQHAKIDVLEIDKMLDDLDEASIDVSVDQYFGILRAFDGLLAQQVDMDIASLQAATGRALSADEQNEIRRGQIHSYRNDFLLMGMTNRMFVRTFDKLSATAGAKLRSETKTYEA